MQLFQITHSALAILCHVSLFICKTTIVYILKNVQLEKKKGNKRKVKKVGAKASLSILTMFYNSHPGYYFEEFIGNKLKR